MSKILNRWFREELRLDHAHETSIWLSCAALPNDSLLITSDPKNNYFLLELLGNKVNIYTNFRSVRVNTNKYSCMRELTSGCQPNTEYAPNNEEMIKLVKILTGNDVSQALQLQIELGY